MSLIVSKNGKLVFNQNVSLPTANSCFATLKRTKSKTSLQISLKTLQRIEPFCTNLQAQIKTVILEDKICLYMSDLVDKFNFDGNVEAFNNAVETWLRNIFNSQQ